MKYGFSENNSEVGLRAWWRRVKALLERYYDGMKRLLPVILVLLFVAGCADPKPVRAPIGYTPEKIRQSLEIGVDATIGQERLTALVNVLKGRIDDAPDTASRETLEAQYNLRVDEYHSLKMMRESMEATLAALLLDPKTTETTGEVIEAYRKELDEKEEVASAERNGLLTAQRELTPEEQRRLESSSDIAQRYARKKVALAGILERVGYSE
jgi:hypothetical protein